MTPCGSRLLEIRVPCLRRVEGRARCSGPGSGRSRSTIGTTAVGPYRLRPRLVACHSQQEDQMPFTRNPGRLAQVACLTLLASLASGSVMPGAVGASDSLIGLWHLDGNAQDSSGNSHDGTINGAIPTTGVSGQAYSFDGSAGISVGNLDFSSGQYTVNIWFRTRVPAVSEDWRMMVAKTNIPAGDQTFELAIGDGRDNGAGNAPFFLVWDNGSGPVNIASPAGLNTRDGNWHMATATYIFGDQRLYVDGCLVGTSAYAGPLPIISDDVVIGGVNGFGPYHHPWKGDLDEVSIHGRPLDPREILALWKLHGGATTCLGENGLPVAGNDTASTAEETALLITGAALLANDTDPDGDSLTITGVSPSATTYGSLSLAHGSVTYIPGPNYNGLASFTYTISDGNGGTAAASVDVVVRP